MGGKQLPLSYKAIIFPISRQSAMRHFIFYYISNGILCKKVQSHINDFLETPDVDPPA